MNNVKIHQLHNGATVISLSAHPFTFSDGSVSEPQSAEVVKGLTMKRESQTLHEIKGMKINWTRFTLTQEQLDLLRELCSKADIVILPFPVLSTLREMGVRDQFRNAVAFNATPETQRTQEPSQKIVDINNWSY